MRSFNSYLAEKDLVEGLVALNVDVDQFCEQVLRLARKNNLNEESLNEIFGLGKGIQNIARGVGGALGLVTKPIHDAGKGIATGATMAKDYVQAQAGKAKDYVQKQAREVGNYVGNAYQQGAQKESMRQATDRISGLQNALIGMGMEKQKVDNLIANLTQIVNTHVQQQQAAQSGGGAPAA